MVRPMRRSGPTTTLRGLGAHDHVCWIYDRHVDFVERAVEFMLDGMVLGQRVEYLRTGDHADLLADVEGLPAADELIDAGRLVLTPLDGVYGSGLPIEPQAQVATYAARTEAALAAGFTGLRVVAEATALVDDPGRLEQFTRYEHLVDRYMSAHPFAAMCAYDRGVLGADAAARLACVHPLGSPDASPFHLFTPGGYAPDVDAATLALAGEVDVLGSDLFRRALERAGDPDPGGTLRVDASHLDFIDHRGMLDLEEHAARMGLRSLVLESAGGAARRLVDLLDLQIVRVELRR